MNFGFVKFVLHIPNNIVHFSLCPPPPPLLTLVLICLKIVHTSFFPLQTAYIYKPLNWALHSFIRCSKCVRELEGKDKPLITKMNFQMNFRMKIDS